MQMKTLRLLLTSLLLGSLFITQMSSPATCQMVAGISRVICPMPCCKSIPMPSCPHMRLAPAPQDRIAASPVAPTVLQIAHQWVDRLIIHPLRPLHFFEEVAQNLQLLTLASPFLGRSPPQD